MLLISCDPKESTGLLPVVTTASISNITATTAQGGGNATSADGIITASGVCWSTSAEPTIENAITISADSVGDFTSNISGLTDSTTYYVRAYATNSAGTAYGNTISFTTLSLPVAVTDIDGNAYHAVTIGTKTWLIENLRTTKYKNGDAISTTSTLNQNISTETAPKYQWAYNGDETLAKKYGRLYTWHVVSDARGIAPTGWHIASDADWLALENYLIATYGTVNGTIVNQRLGKYLAATTDWAMSATEGHVGNNKTINNATGFSAYPGGLRNSSGVFSGLGTSTTWWTNTTYSTTNAYFRSLYYNNDRLYKETYGKEFGFAVRCVKD